MGPTADAGTAVGRRIVSVVGTRPQLIKAAALQPALRARHVAILVDTAQHWDDRLAGQFYRELGLLRPDHSLDAGGGTHAEQTAQMLVALEPVLAEERPDAVVVFGDTNSTLAGALAAAKLGIPVAHVEAGLRSFDRRMPEEVNRVVADHLSHWLFAPTPTAATNLKREGIREGVHLVGDVMQDLASRTVSEIRDPKFLAEVQRQLDAEDVPALAPGGYVYATIHRQENREPAAIARWAKLLERIATRNRPVVLALHPGTTVAMQQQGVDVGGGVLVVEPMGYRSSLALQLHAAAVLTDSGGVQREAAWLGTPCLVLRGSTEWVEAVESSGGSMQVVGLDADLAVAALARVAPLAVAERQARDRAAHASIAESGAAAAISEVLAS